MVASEKTYAKKYKWKNEQICKYCLKEILNDELNAKYAKEPIKVKV